MMATNKIAKEITEKTNIFDISLSFKLFCSLCEENMVNVLKEVIKKHLNNYNNNIRYLSIFSWVLIIKIYPDFKDEIAD